MEGVLKYVILHGTQLWFREWNNVSTSSTLRTVLLGMDTVLFVGIIVSEC